MTDTRRVHGRSYNGLGFGFETVSLWPVCSDMGQSGVMALLVGIQQSLVATLAGSTLLECLIFPGGSKKPMSDKPVVVNHNPSFPPL
jgi:hypothetical protein